MREIKFRAWDEINEKIVRVDSVDFVNRHLYFLDSQFKGNPTFVMDFKLMQCTGLKDKNGVELYHGDIINVSGHLSQIMCENSFVHFFFWCESLGEYTGLAFLLGYKNFEIVGNIYENPELLEGEQ